MPGRTLPWRNACPPLVVQRLRELSTSRLLLIHEKGPTSFVIKAASSNSNGKKFTVGLGDVHSCTCLESRSEMCIHILFVLQKIFRIPAANSLLYQRSFLDSELNDLIVARNRMMRTQQQQHLSGHEQRLRRLGIRNDLDDDENTNENSTPQSSTIEEVQRKPITADDSCPICCDDFQNVESDSEELVWCRFGCGGSIHIDCFRQYCQHHATRSEPLTCPLCRCKWSQLEAGDFGGDLPKHAPGTKCDACRAEIVYGERYRCCYCSRFDLCPGCYNNRPHVHAQHPFDFQHGPNARFDAAPPRPLPSATQSNALTRHQQGQQQQSNSPTTAAASSSSTSNVFESPARRYNNTTTDQDQVRRLTLNETLRFAKPFSEAILEHLEKYAASEHYNFDEGKVPECPICLEAFENVLQEDSTPSAATASQLPERLVVLPSCKHLYHVTCATNWLVHGAASCPFCKIPVTTVNLSSAASSTPVTNTTQQQQQQQQRSPRHPSSSSSSRRQQSSQSSQRLFPPPRRTSSSTTTALARSLPGHRFSNATSVSSSQSTQPSPQFTVMGTNHNLQFAGGNSTHNNTTNISQQQQRVNNNNRIHRGRPLTIRNNDNDNNNDDDDDKNDNDQRENLPGLFVGVESEANNNETRSRNSIRESRSSNHVVAIVRERRRKSQQQQVNNNHSNEISTNGGVVGNASASTTSSSLGSLLTVVSGGGGKQQQQPKASVPTTMMTRRKLPPSASSSTTTRRVSQHQQERNQASRTGEGGFTFYTTAMNSLPTQ